MFLKEGNILKFKRNEIEVLMSRFSKIMVDKYHCYG